MLDPRLPDNGPEYAGPRPDAGRGDLPPADRAADAPLADAPLADREVPLRGAEEAFPAVPAAVHAWLDGEGTAADARLADARQVELWQKIGDETARRARMKTPAHVSQQIMDALPARPAAATADARLAPAARVEATPTARPSEELDGRLSLAPATAAFFAAVLIGAGFLLGRILG